MDAPEYFKQHMADDDRRFGEIFADTQAIRSDVATIKDNHLAHIEPAVAGLVKETAKQSVDLFWIKYLVMGIVTGLGGLTILLIVFLIEK
jgi:hypothetical protein